MGSVSNPNTLPPYDSYRDCSLGICSVYCPQWCYIIFPPPPPLFEQPREEGDSGTNFSPLIIAVIGILASAFLLVSYYTIISKYCKRRRSDHQLNTTPESELNTSQVTNDHWQLASAGLDEGVIKSIAVCKYKEGDGLIEGTDCAVCLSEFQEDECLRLLPKCSHAFHIACIDTWLRSHSNCPLCRSNVTPGNSIPTAPPAPVSQASSNLNISSVEFHRRNDLVLVVEERERGYQEEVVVSHDLTPKPPFPFQLPFPFQGGTEFSENLEEVRNGTDGEVGVQEFRRSVSMGSFSFQPNLLIADILCIDEDDEDLQVAGTGTRIGIGIGSSEGENSKPNNIVRSPVTMKRSVSTGRFMFMKKDKGKASILPN